MNPLQDLQCEFQSFLLNGDQRIFDRVRSSATTGPARRLGIYYDAYRLRLIEALEADYTALLAALGEEAFREMACAYIETTPSRHRNLRWYGGALPEFLRTSSSYGASVWLHELALFEWNITLAFDAADESPLTFAGMAAVDPSLWPGLSFRFHPSLRRLSLASNAPLLRKAADAGEDLPKPNRGSEEVQWLLWRQDLVVMFKSLPPEEAWALDRACDGMNFAGLCEGVCQWAGEEEAASRIAQLLRGWVDDHLIVSAVQTA
ncbi:MAG: DUF2063 domain-containing protein [Burkholderiales bacterium]